MSITVQSLIASSSSSSASRELLFSTDVSYVLSANRTVAQIVIVPLLRSVLFSANYVTSLRNYSGFSNITVSNIVITDLSPTAAPTSAPATKAGKKTIDLSCCDLKCTNSQ